MPGIALPRSAIDVTSRTNGRGDLLSHMGEGDKEGVEDRREDDDGEEGDEEFPLEQGGHAGDEGKHQTDGGADHAKGEGA